MCAGTLHYLGYYVKQSLYERKSQVTILKKKSWPSLTKVPGLQSNLTMSSHVTMTTNKQSSIFSRTIMGVLRSRHITRMHETRNRVFMTLYPMRSHRTSLAYMAGVVCCHSNAWVTWNIIPRLFVLLPSQGCDL